MWTRRDWLVGLSAGMVGAPAQTAPDTLFVNGNLITLDRANRVLDAIGVRDGKVIAKAGASRNARVVDLRGRTLLPGFYAAHDHFPSWGTVALFQVDLSSPPVGRIETMADVISALQAHARQTPPGEWIVGRGYDDTLLREQRHPNRHDLDQASLEHPIWIVHVSGHLGAANSRALELAGINRDTPPSKQGVIHREADGGPDGVFEENGSLVSHLIPGHSPEQRMQAIERANAEYLSKGVTTTVIAGTGRQGIADLRGATVKGLLHLRAVCLMSSGIPAKFAQAAALEGDGVRITGVKLFQDGSLQGYTGHLSQPYFKTPAGKPDYRGYSNRSQEALNTLVSKHHQAGFQIAIYANGDEAIGEVLTAYREAQKNFPRAGARHRIEHCQTARPDQLDAIAEMGVTPSFFVDHVYYWGDRHRDLFLGPERAARISPLGSALRRGIRFTVHNDTPVTPVDPLHLVWCAVNRKTRAGMVLGPDERITIVPALRTVTSEAAWQNGEEDRKGAIEPGKLADFVVLEENLLKVEAERLRELRVLETIVGGATVYQR